MKSQQIQWVYTAVLGLVEQWVSTGAMGIYWRDNGYLLEQWVSTGAMGIYWSNGYLLVCRDNGYLLSITHRSEDYISSDTVNALVTIAETTKHC